MALLETSSSESWTRLRRWVAAPLVAGALVVVARPALASEPFPGVIQETFKDDMTCAPPCTICHTTPAGGTGTATQPFALNAQAMAVGVGKPFIESDLPVILRAAETEPCQIPTDPACGGVMPCMAPCDADNDGVTDIAELKAGTNPNNTSTLPCVEYGCGSHVAPERSGRPIDGTAALAAFGVLAVLVRRWRRR